MSKKVAAVIVGTTGAVLAGVLGYAAYLNRRYDLDLEHLHEEDDYEEDEDCLFGCGGAEEDGENLSECEDGECEDFDFGSDEPHDGIDLFKSRESDPFMNKDTPEGFGFAPNNGSMADGLSGSMADGFSAGATFGGMGMPNLTVSDFGSIGMPNFTVSDIPMSKESRELWQKFSQARAKDAQNYMNRCKKK